MAEQFDITSFGEGLVQRQRQQRKRTQKRATRNAWKQGLAMAGVNLINRSLATKANEFLQSEQAMAVKARYASANEQAQRIIQMREQAAEQGLSMPEYFMTNTYLPAVQAEFQAQYGTKYNPTSYAPQLREIAWDLAQKEAAEYELALAKAMEVPAWEEVNQNLNELITPPRSAGQALLGKVKGMFTGKGEDEVRQEILERLDQEGAIRNDSYRRYFDRVLVDKGLDEAVARVRAIAPSDMEQVSILQDHVDIRANPGGGISVTTWTTNSDGQGNQSIVGKPETKTVDTTTKAGKVEAFQASLETDLLGLADDLLTREALSQYNTILGQGANGTPSVNESNIRRVVESPDGSISAPNYMFAAETLTRFLSDPANLKDPERDQRVVDLATATLNNMGVALDINLSDPEKFMETLLQGAEFGRALEAALIQRTLPTSANDL